MADRGLINTEYLSDIADAIRSKAGTSDTYKPTEMADAINNLPSGGSKMLFGNEIGQITLSQWELFPVWIYPQTLSHFGGVF